MLFDNLVVGVENRWECADDSLATRGILLGCAALVGAIDATVALTSRYVSEREQFGRPLTALQSVAQAVALMRCQLSAARAAVEAARQSPTVMNCLAAHVDIADCAGRVARTAHDLHGAMGVAGEYDLHLVHQAPVGVARGGHQADGCSHGARPACRRTRRGQSVGRRDRLTGP